ncbi:hypothetical protein BTVI_61252 [Pitangus sulphuratus]|nr:hypothetical protein BTVI_61252 [Pitangus sulphuratus]
MKSMIFSQALKNTLDVSQEMIALSAAELSQYYHQRLAHGIQMDFDGSTSYSRLSEACSPGEVLHPPDPLVASSGLAPTAQDTVGSLGCKGTLPSHVQPLIQQHPNSKMAELFMECEEEELEPWQKTVTEVEEDDDDDDDDEPIFVGEITSSKPATTCAVPAFKTEGHHYASAAPSAVPVPSVFQTAPRPASSSGAGQPLAMAGNVSAASQTLQRPVAGCLSTQQLPGASSGITQPVTIPVTAQPASRNIPVPAVAQPVSRPETGTAQPVMLNQDYIMDSLPDAADNKSDILFGVRQNSGVPQYQTGPAVNVTAICKICELSFETEQVLLQHMKDNHKPGEMPYVCQVTIRASLGSHQSGSSATSSVSTSSSTFQLSPKTKATTTKNHSKSNTNKSRGKSKQTTSKKQNAWTNSKKKKEVTNITFHHLRCRSGHHKCIECYSEIKDFASHFPAYVHCSLCRYSTSCSKAYVNHMMKGLTVVCLNCDFLADVSGLDSMATHLSESHTHTCQVIIEKVSVDIPTAAQVSDKQEHDSSDETKKCSRNPTKTVASAEKNEEDASLSNTEDVPSFELPGNSSKKSLHEKRACCASDDNNKQLDEKQKGIHDGSELKRCQSSGDVLLDEQTEVRSLDESSLSAMNVRDLKLTLGEDVSFEQFFRKRDEPESVSSDISEQGSIHLEPLTPSEVLEHEATEILQKGNVTPSSKKAGQLTEQTDDVSKESNPNRMETTANQTDENEAR